MKSKKSIIVVIAIAFVVIGIGLFLKSDMFKKINSDYVGGTVRCGYLENKKSQIITSYEELENFCDEKYANGKLDIFLEKYDEKYFEEKSLALVYETVGSGGIDIEFVAATKDENSVTVMYKFLIPNGGLTADMSGYIVYVEVDKDITNMITCEI